MHPTFICTLSHEVVSSKRGSHVPSATRSCLPRGAAMYPQPRGRVLQEGEPCTLSHEVVSSKRGSHVPSATRLCPPRGGAMYPQLRGCVLQEGEPCTETTIPRACILIDNASSQKYLLEPSMNYELSLLCCITIVTLSCHQLLFLL